MNSGPSPSPGERRGHRRAQGELEAQALTLLRSAPGPVTAGWLQQRLEGNLAYTTVVTILSRLHAKSAVCRQREGRSYLWTAVADESGLAARRMQRVLDSEDDRNAVLTSFVSALSPDDEHLLRDLLADTGPGQADDSAPSAWFGGDHGTEPTDGPAD